MDNFLPNRSSNLQLEDILYETAHSVVNGRRGQVLCCAASLRQAIVKEEQFTASGAVVIAICRLPFDNIVAFIEQLDRRRRSINVRELIQ
jgi:hypothetical protein